MNTLLGFLLFSFTINAALIIPFINLLYTLKFQKTTEKATDFRGVVNKVCNKLHKAKAATPVGGGFLLILTTSLLFFFTLISLKVVGADITSVYPIRQEINIIFGTFLLYGLLGLYDDVAKFFQTGDNGTGISMRKKLLLQLSLGLLLGWYMYSQLGIQIVNIPYFGVINLGIGFIPFSSLVITGFSNAVNITDGLDGLASGLLMIALFALVILSNSILDTPITIFIALWIGGLLAFLYFNTYPARIFLGDVGSLSFGATLAVIGLILGKIIAVSIIGGIFLLEVTSSFIQIIGKKYFGKRILPIAPFHLWLQEIGWDEPKIVTRAWLAGIALALFGLWLAFL